MKKLFHYLGDMTIPYRTIMADHTDFIVAGLRIPKLNTIIAEQAHSKHVHICTPSDSGAGFDSHPQIPDCDAMITNHANQFLMIRTADCTPVLFYDINTESIGAAHSGREGTRKNIVRQLINTMQAEYYSNPADIQVWIGAGICRNHYQVSENIWQEFNQSCIENSFINDNNDTTHIDIQNIIYQQLVQAGIKPEMIYRNDVCTFESQEHFSFRKDGTHNRQINLIGLIDG
jgi:polyphenol oxidase